MAHQSRAKLARRNRTDAYDWRIGTPCNSLLMCRRELRLISLANRSAPEAGIGGIAETVVLCVCSFAFGWSTAFEKGVRIHELQPITSRCIEQASGDNRQQ